MQPCSKWTKARVRPGQSITYFSTRQLSIQGYTITEPPGGTCIRISRPFMGGIITHIAWFNPALGLYDIELSSAPTTITKFGPMINGLVCVSNNPAKAFVMTQDAFAGFCSSPSSVPGFLAHTHVGNQKKGYTLHCRFGHVGKDQRLLRVLQTEYGPGVKFDFRCSSCIETKAKTQRTRFDPSRRKAHRPGYRIHADIAVLHNFPGLGGGKYFAVLVDEFSTYYFVAILKTKSEFLGCLKYFTAYIKNHIGQAVKKIEEGRGMFDHRRGEDGSIGRLFDAYYRLHNIDREPYAGIEAGVGVDTVTGAMGLPS